ncbi:hypothetical protein ANCCAN_29916 [Ancylostoma caninum]|uniref:Uncharacterized protein n=1 Tax=Ancylostoma caninum TaxID=29170 RepID=A0A368F2F8_ANCCA|nr:hypothetical protein ANCCAN_29916 [Ancylostoma caninum]
MDTMPSYFSGSRKQKHRPFSSTITGQQQSSQCANAELAITQFHKCEAQHTCACVPNKISVQCVCSSAPVYSQNCTITMLPLRRPHLEISRNNSAVIAIEKDAEVAILLSTTKRFAIAQQAIDPPCRVLASELVGCYSCQEAARTTLSCYSSRTRQVTLDCSEQSLLLSYSDKNEIANVILQYDSAHVSDNCYYKCGGQTHTLNIRGTLVHHSSIPEHVVLGKESTEEHALQMPQLSLPDLRPLISTFKEHWHVALASVAGVGIFALLTYSFGPVVLLFLLKFAAEVLQAAVNIIFACLRGVIQALAEVRRR